MFCYREVTSKLLSFACLFILNDKLRDKLYIIFIYILVISSSHVILGGKCEMIKKWKSPIDSFLVLSSTYKTYKIYNHLFYAHNYRIITEMKHDYGQKKTLTIQFANFWNGNKM